MNHGEAFAGKIEALRTLLIDKKLDAIILRRNPNLAWAVSGRSHVPTTIDAACFDAGVCRAALSLFTREVLIEAHNPVE